MRVIIEEATPNEVAELGPEAALEKLVTAFGELGELVTKAGPHYGDVDGVDELVDTLKKAYGKRIAAMQRDLVERVHGG